MRKAFWEEVTGFMDAMTKKERLALMAELALGRHSESPFRDKIGGIRANLDSALVEMGMSLAARRQIETVK